MIQKYLLKKNTKETKVARQPSSTSFSFQGNKETTVLPLPEGSCSKQEMKRDSEEVKQDSEPLPFSKIIFEHVLSILICQFTSQ